MLHKYIRNMTGCFLFEGQFLSHNIQENFTGRTRGVWRCSTCLL